MNGVDPRRKKLAYRLTKMRNRHALVMLRLVPSRIHAMRIAGQPQYRSVKNYHASLVLSFHSNGMPQLGIVMVYGRLLLCCTRGVRSSGARDCGAIRRLVSRSVGVGGQNLLLMPANQCVIRTAKPQRA